jgi:hypothetical protein
MEQSLAESVRDFEENENLWGMELAEAYKLGWIAALLYASYHPRLDWAQTVTGAGFSKPQH